MKGFQTYLDEIDITDYSDTSRQSIPGFGLPLHLHDTVCVDAEYGNLTCHREDVPHTAALDDDERDEVIEYWQRKHWDRATQIDRMMRLGAFGSGHADKDISLRRTTSTR